MGTPETGSDDERRKRLEIALDNRKFEISLLWQRTLVFWGFVAALFVAVATTIKDHRGLAAALCGTGFVFSVIWTLVNRGSRSWQESWEIKAEAYFEDLYHGLGQSGTGEGQPQRRRESGFDLFRRARRPQLDVVWLLRSRGYSVSRLLIAVSDFSCVVWLALLAYVLSDRDKPQPSQMYLLSIFLVFCIAYAIYVMAACRERSDSNVDAEL